MPEQSELSITIYDENEFPPERIKFYETQAQRVLDAHNREFHEFIRGKEALEKLGDEILCRGEGTGYNIVLAELDMPLTSRKNLIFYNNYIGRPQHFGLLLANMEARGIITPDIIRFSKKATKVLYDGSWDLEPKDEFEEKISYTNGVGIIYEKNVNRTVETVIIFSPMSKTQAAKIADYLLERADRNKNNCIEGSWEVPDIRATLSLADVLIRPGPSDFRIVVANIHEINDARLIVLRQRTRFDQTGQPDNSMKWISDNSTQNEKLAQFLTNEDVQP